MVNLQSVFEAAFELGFYAKSLNYHKPPPVAVGADDTAWIAHVLAQHNGS